MGELVVIRGLRRIVSD